MIIYDKLSWKSHINHVHNKLSRSISVLNKAKHVLDHKSLYILYSALILPCLNYCSEVWGNTHTHTYIYIYIYIYMLQKRAIRVIHKIVHRDHTNSLFLISKKLKFIDLVHFQTAQIMYKAKNHLLPGNIQKNFLNGEERYNLRRE